MPTTREDIRIWFKDGIKRKATHLVVACNTFDYEDYPVFVTPADDVAMVAANIQKVMEVYDLSMDMETQLDEKRAFHGWSPFYTTATRTILSSSRRTMPQR